MISLLLSRLVLLICGTLYPAYASYKTVKTKNVRDYVKWMMYWIVFAIYTFIEIFADIFLSFWFPFYYELKILFVLWLVCPATRGSTYIFRKVLNPQLSKHEVKIDAHIASVKDQSYELARKVGARGMDYVVEILFELLRKGQVTATHLLPKMSEMTQSTTDAPPPVGIRGSESLSDLNAEEFVIMTDASEADDPPPPRKKKVPSDVEKESCSEAEEIQPKKIPTKSKRATSLRERKKVTRKRSPST